MKLFNWLRQSKAPAPEPEQEYSPKFNLLMDLECIVSDYWYSQGKQTSNMYLHEVGEMKFFVKNSFTPCEIESDYTYEPLESSSIELVKYWLDKDVDVLLDINYGPDHGEVVFTFTEKQ